MGLHGGEVMDLHIAVLPRLQTASSSTMVLGLSITQMVGAIHRPITVHSLLDFTAKNSVLTLISLLARMKLFCICQSPTHTERCKYFKYFVNNVTYKNFNSFILPILPTCSNWQEVIHITSQSCSCFAILYVEKIIFNAQKYRRTALPLKAN